MHNTEVIAARFYDCPEVFRVQGHEGFAPAMHYRLDARMDGVRHTVTWTDRTKASTPEADRLRSLFTRLIALIVDHPSVKLLPHAKVGCG